MRLSRLALLVLLVGCARKRDGAPEDVDGLSRYLFANWEDPEAMAEGMENLSVWLEAEGRSEAAADGYVLTDLVEDEVSEVEHPARDLTDMIGVAVPGVSVHPIEAHAGLLVMTDQVWNDPGSYDLYVRELVEGDPDAFVAGDGLIRTRNDIDKSGAFGVHIPYILWKDYRWVALEDGRQSIVARSWVEEEACAEGGNNCLFQSFSIDLFHAPNGDETIRMTASWNELVTSADSLLTDDARIGLMVNGINDVFDNTDDFLTGE